MLRTQHNKNIGFSQDDKQVFFQIPLKYSHDAVPGKFQQLDFDKSQHFLKIWC